MDVAEHQRSVAGVRVFVLTISDTRTPATDRSGALCQELVVGAGHLVAGQAIVEDDAAKVTALLRQLGAEKRADVVVMTGGTGITRRDSTYEAVTSLLDKRLDGFGELFRMLSFSEVGARALLSRAVAGLYGDLVLFSLPGSTAAVRLGLERLIVPVLGHLLHEARR